MKIKKIIFMSQLYQYDTVALLSEEDEKYIGLGCHFRTVDDWEKDFWNNNREFPNDGSVKSKLRVFAFETLKNWCKIVE